jgi:hypothetical protein
MTLFLDRMGREREFRSKRSRVLAEEESFLIFSAVQQQLHDGAHSCTTAPIDVRKSWNLFSLLLLSVFFQKRNTYM